MKIGKLAAKKFDPKTKKERKRAEWEDENDGAPVRKKFQQKGVLKMDDKSVKISKKNRPNHDRKMSTHVPLGRTYVKVAPMTPKGQEGAAVDYTLRNKAIDKLQLSVAEFRRMCILKGIYPRDPPRVPRGLKVPKDQPLVFYYTKDVEFMKHEPMIDVIRKQKFMERKLIKAASKEDYLRARNLDLSKPVFKVDHMIRDRYPTFLDALRDIDDALSTLHLFAMLPRADTVIEPAMTARCQRLALEWQRYLVHTRTLDRAFLSIKGIYYQATVHGIPIIWIAPYAFNHVVPPTVDLRVMATFLELYTALLGFVLFKLYSEQGLVYPPACDENLDEHGNAGLTGFLLQAQNQTYLPGIKKADVVAADCEQQTKVDEVVKALPDEPWDDVTQVIEEEEEGEDEEDEHNEQQELTTRHPTDLFKSMHIYLSRETPIAALILVLASHSVASISYPETFASTGTYNEKDLRITHQIADRPTLGSIVPDRIYVQPQWVFDCINAGELLDTQLYVIGATLPPHLSPFEEPGGYDPNEPLTDEEYEENKEQLRRAGEVGEDVEEFTGLDEEDQRAVLDAKEHQAELVAELAGATPKPGPKKSKKQQAQQTDLALKEEAEARAMALTIMPKNSRKKYEEMTMAARKRSDEISRLRARRRDIYRRRQQVKSH